MGTLNYTHSIIWPAALCDSEICRRTSLSRSVVTRLYSLCRHATRWRTGTSLSHARADVSLCHVSLYNHFIGQFGSVVRSAVKVAAYFTTHANAEAK